MNVHAARRHIGALGLALMIALFVRLLWVANVHPDPGTDGRFDDTVWYRGAAHFIARGEGYLNPFTGTPTAGWPPGYPFFLGGVFAAFGEGVTQTWAANIAVALVTVAIVYAIAVLLFDLRTAAVAAIALALWPGQVYFSSLTMSEPLFTMLFALGVLLMLLVPRAEGRSRDVTIVAFGLVVGLGTLTRGQALVLLPVAFVWWGIFAARRGRESERWQPALTWAILAALVAAVTLSPWVARNQQQLGRPVIISTNMGPNLWIGHHDGATGRMSIPEPEPPQPDKIGKTQPQIEVAADTLALRRGLAYMFTHPGDELRLSGEKIRAMYESDATALDWNSGYSSGYYASDRVENSLRDLANGFWFGALILAGFGLVVSRGRLLGDVALLPLLVLGWTATHLLFFGDSRFHYPIVFVFALLAGRALVVVFDAVRRPETNLEKGYAAA